MSMLIYFRYRVTLETVTVVVEEVATEVVMVEEAVMAVVVMEEEEEDTTPTIRVTVWVETSKTSTGQASDLKSSRRISMLRTSALLLGLTKRFKSSVVQKRSL